MPPEVVVGEPVSKKNKTNQKNDSETENEVTIFECDACLEMFSSECHLEDHTKEMLAERSLIHVFWNSW